MSGLTSRSMHDLGLAAWFGGSLMGAIGLNGAAAAAHDPTERTRLSTLGWKRWTPVQIAAIGVHALGGLGQLRENAQRVTVDSGSRRLTMVKNAVTAGAAAITLYSGVLGSQVARHEHEGAAGATEPGAQSSTELARAQRQLQVTQWAIPALTSILVVLGAQHGEQQRGIRGLLDVVRS